MPFFYSHTDNLSGYRILSHKQLFLQIMKALFHYSLISVNGIKFKTILTLDPLCMSCFISLEAYRIFFVLNMYSKILWGHAFVWVYFYSFSGKFRPFISSNTSFSSRKYSWITALRIQLQLFFLLLETLMIQILDMDSSSNFMFLSYFPFLNLWLFFFPLGEFLDFIAQTF